MVKNSCEGAGTAVAQHYYVESPCRNVVPLHCNVVSPHCNVVSPQCDVVAPQHDVVSPQRDVVSPQHDVVSPQHDVVSPQHDVVTLLKLQYWFQFPMSIRSPELRRYPS